MMSNLKRSSFIVLVATMASVAFAEQVWTIDSQKEWQDITAEQSNLEFKEGMAVLTEATIHATCDSAFRIYDQGKLSDVISLKKGQSKTWPETK